MTLPVYVQKELAWMRDAQVDENVSEEEYYARANQLVAYAQKLSPEQFEEFQNSLAALEQIENDRLMTGKVREIFQTSTALLLEADEVKETWKIGPLTVVLPVLANDLSLESYGALQRKREAELTGKCVCGGEAEVHNGKFQVAHDLTCPANDSNISRILQETPRFINK